ncbi:CHAT domain-containing protein [Stackebrandtia nassauensis]|uniref:CHAT domain-containing protein n=1 Tax=Stackebrandtia nassauensis TaxID=283811 RepID=UPI00145E680C|nr:CHAT domain-containing protein [Stackebrandtia nassauensis]
MSNPESETIAEAWRLQREGIDTLNAGRPADGAAILRRGLELVGWAEGRRFTAADAMRHVAARLLGCIALAEAELGRGPHGLELLDTADTLVSGEDRGILVFQRGVILRHCGRTIDALRTFDDAELLLVRNGQDGYLTRLLLNRGSANNDLGRYRQAREDLRRCEALASQHDLQDWLAKSFHARGIAEDGLGDIPSALASYSQAEQLYLSTAPDLIPQLALTRAATLRDAGLRRDAALYLDTAIRELEQRQRDVELLRSEVMRAKLAVEMGDLELAVSLASRARQRAEAQQSAAFGAWAEFTLCHAEYLGGRTSLAFAAETLEVAHRLRAVSRFHFAELAELLAARVFTVNGMFDRAAEIVGERPRRSGYELLTANATRYLARAELAVAIGDRPTALRHLRTGLAGLHRHRESFGSLELQAGVSSIGTQLAELGLGLALESKRSSTVFEWAERSRGQAFRLPSVRPADDPGVADMLAKVRDLRAFISRAKQEGVSAETEKSECDALEAELRQRDWQTTGPGKSAPEVKPRQIHQALAETDRALVSFIHHDGRLHALTMVSGRNRLHDLGSMTDIEESLRRLMADLNAITGRRLPVPMATAVRSSIARQSEALDSRLLAPFRRRLGDRELVIIPTQRLYDMPWGLLPSLRSHPVTVSPSAAVWLAALKHSPDNHGQPLLASGPDLSLAEAELDTISEHYYDPILLRDTEATPTAILSKLDGAPIAHLAAHGHHEPDNVLFSSLDLSGGPLMAYDIARLRTPPAHVTLSACDVGQSKVSVGDETLGFTAALLYAGTRTVVSSVAKVEHEAAADIMTAYHAHLVEGLPPAHALAEASQLHPFSPFVCYGAS